MNGQRSEMDGLLSVRVRVSRYWNHKSRSTSTYKSWTLAVPQWFLPFWRPWWVHVVPASARWRVGRGCQAGRPRLPRRSSVNPNKCHTKCGYLITFPTLHHLHLSSLCTSSNSSHVHQSARFPVSSHCVEQRITRQPSCQAALEE